MSYSSGRMTTAGSGVLLVAGPGRAAGLHIGNAMRAES
jgi:hypothetical protein